MTILSNATAQATGQTASLETRFVSQDETDRLTQALDLALEEQAQVAGCARPAFPWEICQCVNCCAWH